MIYWTDETRKGEIESSKVKIGMFKLVVHHYIGYPKDMWFASVYGLFERKSLASKDLSQAKTQAVAIFQCILENAIKEIVE